MQYSGDILVVDDEIDIVNLVVDVLQDEGYNVRAVTNGAAAIAAIEQQKPAMILMDMYMPQMTGIMLLEHLEERGIDHIPVVLMTASPRAAEQVRTYRSTDYLAKPFDIEQLLASVARYVILPVNSSNDTGASHPL